MPGYPIAWTEKWACFDSGADGSPYSAAEIEAYLVNCDTQYSPKQPPLAIRSVDFVLSRSFSTRRFWLWRLVDDRGTSWFAVIGSGAGPFQNDRTTDRWIYAQTNDEDLPPEEFLDAEIAKHP